MKTCFFKLHVVHKISRERRENIYIFAPNREYARWKYKKAIFSPSYIRGGYLAVAREIFFMNHSRLLTRAENKNFRLALPLTTLPRNNSAPQRNRKGETILGRGHAGERTGFERVGVKFIREVPAFYCFIRGRQAYLKSEVGKVFLEGIKVY